MIEMRKRWALTAAALLGLIAVPAQAPAAPAKDGDVLVRGTCTGRSTSKLKLSDEDGRIEVEFEVDQNRNGQRWRVVLRRDGDRFFRGVRETHAPSGSFEVSQRPGNTPGPNRIKARAVNLGSGQVCTGALTI
jgi:hypothetical protein